MILLSNEVAIERLLDLSRSMTETALCMQAQWPSDSKALIRSAKAAKDWAEKIQWGVDNGEVHTGGRG